MTLLPINTQRCPFRQERLNLVTTKQLASFQPCPEGSSLSVTRETILEGGLITSHEAKPPEKTRLSTGKKWSGPKEVGGTWGFVVDKFL